MSARGWSAAIHDIVAEGAAAWELSPQAVVALWMIPVALVAGGLVTAALGKPAYKWYTGEDHFVETLQAIFYIVGLVFAVRVMLRLAVAHEWLLVALYMMLFAGLFFLLGEEVSWGQRLLHITTPEHLREINRQEETNIHNITKFERAFKWAQLLVGAYGTLLPIALRRAGQGARLRRFLSFIVPHLTLVPFFAPLLLWRIYRTFFPRPHRLHFFIAEFNEVFECILGAGLALFMIYQWRRLNREGRSRPAAAA